MVHVKICGITTLADALMSVAAGADALGFNFYRKSPRYIKPSDARSIISELPETILAVGVFVNEPNAKEVARLASEAGVQGVQLHGDESPSYCQELADRFVMKALRVDPQFQPEQAATYDTDAILLDGFTSGTYGGTGKSFDWSIAVNTKALVHKLFLAGGLNPANVSAAIEVVGPYAVDVCSGVESVPGAKDPDKVRAFIAAVQEACSSEFSL
jgi:phosphoribosylanthranilate isomerase